MKKLISFLTLSLVVSTICLAQKNDAKFVIGIESSVIFHSIKNGFGSGWNYSYGLNFEYPIKKFSIGIGLLDTYYGKNYFKDFTGASFIYQYSGENYERYIFNNKEFRLNYLVISNRLNYRLPCNCIFFHAGYNIEILKNIPEKFIEDRTRDTSEEPYIFEDEALIKKINTSIELGIGFKMHINEMLRIIMRQTYNIALLPSQNINKFYQDNYHYLKISFGLQLGIK
jgi:hypothetical protein